MVRVLLILFSVLGSTSLAAQDGALGVWKMLNSNGRWKNAIKLYKKGNEYFGKIVATNPKPGTDPNPLCTRCSGDRENQHVIGMDIITGLHYDPASGAFVGGEILNPKTGKEYACKVWVGADGKLRVRGYKFFFHKTYVLHPAKKDF